MQPQLLKTLPSRRFGTTLEQIALAWEIGGRWLVGANGSYGGKKFTASLNAGFREDYRKRTIQSVINGPDPANSPQNLMCKKLCKFRSLDGGLHWHPVSST